jgi:hypothetical protein
MTESATQSFVKECFQATMEIWKDQTDYETKIDNLVKKYYVDTDVIIIRPSGNPIKADGFKKVIENEEVQVESLEIVSFDSFREMAGGEAAVLTLTRHDKFTYKETSNNDTCKFTYVLENINGSWKLAHVHRATGQPCVKAAPLAAKKIQTYTINNFFVSCFYCFYLLSQV